ncbi:hypothetical protein BLNAU_13487 [Blattamonas nauphoetae]|uniref:Uncharacterized protein n=1 Tax=Blattamonas nauphoetae TaxID=2049346 RepID=A0ABQ9XJU0_9EUKA|nr:hypothetical protein BLNAU_13487 [Blattamonas nauphoetae]
MSIPSSGTPIKQTHVPDHSLLGSPGLSPIPFSRTPDHQYSQSVIDADDPSSISHLLSSPMKVEELSLEPDSENQPQETPPFQKSPKRSNYTQMNTPPQPSKASPSPEKGDIVAFSTPTQSLRVNHNHNAIATPEHTVPDDDPELSPLPGHRGSILYEPPPQHHNNHPDSQESNSSPESASNLSSDEHSSDHHSSMSNKGLERHSYLESFTTPFKPNPTQNQFHSDSPHHGRGDHSTGHSHRDVPPHGTEMYDQARPFDSTIRESITDTSMVTPTLISSLPLLSFLSPPLASPQSSRFGSDSDRSSHLNTSRTTKRVRRSGTESSSHTPSPTPVHQHPKRSTMKNTSAITMGELSDPHITMLSGMSTQRTEDQASHRSGHTTKDEPGSEGKESTEEEDESESEDNRSSNQTSNSQPTAQSLANQTSSLHTPPTVKFKPKSARKSPKKKERQSNTTYQTQNTSRQSHEDSTELSTSRTSDSSSSTTPIIRVRLVQPSSNESPSHPNIVHHPYTPSFTNTPPFFPNPQSPYPFSFLSPQLAAMLPPPQMMLHPQQVMFSQPMTPDYTAVSPNGHQQHHSPSHHTQHTTPTHTQHSPRHSHPHHSHPSEDFSPSDGRHQTPIRPSVELLSKAHKIRSITPPPIHAQTPRLTLGLPQTDLRYRRPEMDSSDTERDWARQRQQQMAERRDRLSSTSPIRRVPEYAEDEQLRKSEVKRMIREEVDGLRQQNLLLHQQLLTRQFPPQPSTQPSLHSRPNLRQSSPTISPSRRPPHTHSHFPSQHSQQQVSRSAEQNRGRRMGHLQLRRQRKQFESDRDMWSVSDESESEAFQRSLQLSDELATKVSSLSQLVTECQEKVRQRKERHRQGYSQRSDGDSRNNQSFPSHNTINTSTQLSLQPSLPSFH